MASFRKLQDLPRPSPDDVQTYRSWLSHGRLVVDDETRFLDHTDDLVCLAGDARDSHPGGDGLFPDDEGVTPMPRAGDDAEQPLSTTGPDDGPSAAPPLPPLQPAAGAPTTLEATLGPLALAMLVALLVPVAAFAVIPTLAGRAVVVAVVGTGVATALAQSGVARLLDRGPLDWALVAGAYGGAMALAAGVLV